MQGGGLQIEDNASRLARPVPLVALAGLSPRARHRSGTDPGSIRDRTGTKGYRTGTKGDRTGTKGDRTGTKRDNAGFRVHILVLSAILAIPLVALAGRGENRAGRRDLPRVDKIRVADLKEIMRKDSGKVILVNAWATWCKPCQDEIPGILKLRKAFRGKPFRLILLSADDADDINKKVRPALKKFKVDFPSYLMNDKSDQAFISGMSSEWNGALPTSFLFDRTGKLKATLVGERTYSQFEDAVTKLLEQ